MLTRFRLGKASPDPGHFFKENSRKLVASEQTEGVNCEVRLSFGGEKGIRGREGLREVPQPCARQHPLSGFCSACHRWSTYAGRPRSSRKSALYALFTLFAALATLLIQSLRTVNSELRSAHLLAARPARPAFKHRCNMLLSWYELSSSSAVVTLSRRSSNGRRYSAPVGTDGAVQAIWQIAKLRTGVPAMVACYTASWDHYNPDWTHEVLDDADMFAIMAEKYDVDFMDKFRALPLGVMRADVFRCGAARATAAAGDLRTHLQSG